MPTDPHTAETYDLLAARYDQHVSDPSDSPLHMYYEKPAIHDELADLRGRSVLSIACGSGNDLDWLKSSGAAHIVGIDLSSGLIDIAHAKYPDLNVAVMDMENLGFADESFDIAYSSLAMHYLESWVQTLSETRRVLKPDGRFVFSCNHPIETAMEYWRGVTERGAHLGRAITEISGTRAVYGDYMAAESNGVRPIITTVADEPVNSYHHTFGRMMADITASGFKIERLTEPLPLQDMEIDNPEHYGQVRKLPKFLIWSLRK